MEEEGPNALEVAKENHESAKEKAQDKQIKTFEEKEVILRLIKTLESKREQHWNISSQCGLVLSQLIALYRPKRILELGTSNAYSTLWLALELERGGKILSIECDQKRYEEAQKNCKRAKIEGEVELVCEEISTYLEENNKLEAFDCVFFDASQRKYLEYFKSLEKNHLLKKGALLLADNVLSHKSTENFTKEIQSRFKSQIIQTNSGLLVAFFE